MKIDILGLLAIASSLIGFVTVWIKVGTNQGRQDKTLEMLDDKTKRHDGDIDGLKQKTHNSQIEIARFMGKIEEKLDNLEKTIVRLGAGGGRRAEKK